jgi:NADH dehydrogenase
LRDKESVFVVGDQAWVERTDTDQPHPMRAQFAVRQGQQAGRNVLASARGRLQNNFHWKDKGMVISAGHGHTFAEVFGIKMSGFFATVAYKSIYLMSTIGFRAKARAVLEWFMNMFLPRDISEL